MALINSVGVGSGSKSVGEFTYRSVRGRTIASKRVRTNSSKSAAQLTQRGLFGLASKFLSLYDCYVYNAFMRTQHGSKRNHAAKSLKDIFPHISSAYQSLASAVEPFALPFAWFAYAMEDVRDVAPLSGVLLQSGNTGISLASFAASPVGNGYAATFAFDKCGAELLSYARAKRPSWSGLSDAEVLRRAFEVYSFGIADGSSAGVFMGVSSWASDAEVDVTPIGGFVTPAITIPLSGVQSIEASEHWGVPADKRIQVWNVLKFLGEPVNVSFAVAFSTVDELDAGMYPIAV